MKIINPATEKLITEIPEDSSESLQRKFREAHSAQKSWARVPLSERLAILTRFRTLIDAQKERLAAILTSEVGKPISQSRNELKGLLTRLDFFLSQTTSILSEETVFDDQGMREIIQHEPLGVIGNISAWNYPYFVGSNVFVPALLAGNAVIYKPSEFASLTGLEIQKLLHEAGVPRAVFAVVIGSGEIGSELCRLPLNGIFFTGSYATGRKINEAVAPQLMKVQLELGGKDPTYVCEDAPIQVAAESLADGAFYNNGQSCCSVERIYVHHKILKPFTEAFLQTVRGFVLGDPKDEKTYLGPVTRSQHLQVLEAQVADALKKGAVLLTGGKRIQRPGFYFEPTVLTNVNSTMELMQEESFGPLIGIQGVGGDDEAIRLMNDTPYGLTSGVYTPDQARAKRILSEIQSGSVYWNCCDRVSPRLPWSGRGHSGIGTTLSKYGILTFVQPKAWHLRSGN